MRIFFLLFCVFAGCSQKSELVTLLASPRPGLVHGREGELRRPAAVLRRANDGWHRALDRPRAARDGGRARGGPRRRRAARSGGEGGGRRGGAAGRGGQTYQATQASTLGRQRQQGE